MAGEVYEIGGPPPEDGMTIDHAPTDEVADQAINIAMLPPSKLAEARQFDILSAWWKADSEFSFEWRGQAKYWFEFRAGEHWTAEDRALLDDQRRPHIVFNRVLTILKAVAGMEINGRHEVAFLPRGVEDAEANEVLSAASRWMSDSCDGEDEESQAFDNCCTTGMGWCENRMSYEDDPTGLYVEEKISPLEMYWDRTARKKNLSDARRMWRVRRMPLADALAMFPGKTRDQLNAVWAVDGIGDYPVKTIEEKWKRDGDNTLDPEYNDLSEVTIVEGQWIEKEVYYLVADEETNSKTELSDQQYQVFERRMKALKMEVIAARLTRKVYKAAFLGAQGVMLKPAGPAPIAGQFKWKCITGELDEIKGTWFGLVKVMRDPQMWANKWLSQILHILNSTAKGGIIAELDAFDDERDAEDAYAHADQIVWAANGAISGKRPKIMPRPGEGKVDAYVGLLSYAVEAIHQVAGINLETLGQKDINQPGVLEMLRKQAGMTVLATLFDSLRRFRKQTGRARLFFIQNFLSDGRLIRIVGPEGAKGVRLAKEKTVGMYDVEVADAPTSPNQKEANWQIIQPMLAIFKDQIMAKPQILAILLEYSPLPARIVEAIKQLIFADQNDPEAKHRALEDRTLFVNAQVASINKDQATAEMNLAKAGSSQATATYDIAMARNLMEDNLRQGRFEDAERQIAVMKAIADQHTAKADGVEKRASTIKLLADADHIRAKADRERAGASGDRVEAGARAHAEVIGAEAKAISDEAKARRDHAAASREQVGAMVDHLVGGAQADRHAAAAEKDRAVARREDRTPVEKPNAKSKA